MLMFPVLPSEFSPSNGLLFSGVVQPPVCRSPTVVVLMIPSVEEASTF